MAAEKVAVVMRVQVKSRVEKKRKKKKRHRRWWEEKSVVVGKVVCLWRSMSLVLVLELVFISFLLFFLY